MGLSKSMALLWIEKQREIQNEKWGEPGSDPTRREHGYHMSTPHLVVLEEKTARIRSIWYDMPRSEEKRRRLFEEFAKIGAIALRALEEMDGPENEEPA